MHPPFQFLWAGALTVLQIAVTHAGFTAGYLAVLGPIPFRYQAELVGPPPPFTLPPLAMSDTIPSTPVDGNGSTNSTMTAPVSPIKPTIAVTPPPSPGTKALDPAGKPSEELRVGPEESNQGESEPSQPPLTAQMLVHFFVGPQATNFPIAHGVSPGFMPPSSSSRPSSSAVYTSR